MNSFTNNLLTISALILGCSDGNKEAQRQPPMAKISDNDIEVRIERLEYRYNTTKQSFILDSLNKITCKSDGFEIDAIDEAVLRIYRKSFVSFTNYLFTHQKSCIEYSFTRGIAAKLSSNDINNRLVAVKQMIDSVKISPLNLDEKKYIIGKLEKMDLKQFD